MVLAVAGVIAGVLVASDAANFGVVQAMIGVGLVAAVVALLTLGRREAAARWRL